MQPSAELQRSQQHAVNGEGEAVAEEDRERPARGRRRRNDRTFAQPEPQAQVPEHQPQTQQEIAERSEEHTSELQSLMRISYAVFCLKKKKKTIQKKHQEKKQHHNETIYDQDTINEDNTSQYSQMQQ